MGSATRRAHLTPTAHRSRPRRSRTPRAPRRSRRTSRDIGSKASRRGGPRFPDLHMLMGHFNDALALVSVSQIAIAANDQAGPEESVLRKGVAALNVVYDELDEADRQLSQAVRVIGRRRHEGRRRP
jgi:hypothetical protein